MLGQVVDCCGQALRWLKARGTRLKTRASRVEGGARDGPSASLRDRDGGRGGCGDLRI